MILTSLNDPINARKAYEKAILLDKNSTPQLYLNFALFEAKQGNSDKAMEYLKQFENMKRKNFILPQVCHCLKSLLSKNQNCRYSHRLNSAHVV